MSLDISVAATSAALPIEGLPADGLISATLQAVMFISFEDQSSETRRTDDWADVDALLRKFRGVRC